MKAGNVISKAKGKIVALKKVSVNQAVFTVLTLKDEKKNKHSLVVPLNIMDKCDHQALIGQKIIATVYQDLSITMPKNRKDEAEAKCFFKKKNTDEKTQRFVDLKYPELKKYHYIKEFWIEKL